MTTELLAIFGPPLSFLVGVLVGRRLPNERPATMAPTRHAPKSPPTAHGARAWFRRKFDRYARVVVVVSFAIGCCGVFLGSVSALSAAKLSSCLKDQAAAKAEGDAALRVAADRLTRNQKRAANTLQRALLAPPESKRQLRLFTEFTAANGRQVAAYVNVQRVRGKYPPVPDPATFCNL